MRKPESARLKAPPLPFSLMGIWPLGAGVLLIFFGVYFGVFLELLTSLDGVARLEGVARLDTGLLVEGVFTILLLNY